jgi:outer membrane protein insertion porin family
VKRAIISLLFALVACGPSAPSITVADKPQAAAFVCPSSAPRVKADPFAVDPLIGKVVAHVCVVGGSSEARTAVQSAIGTQASTQLDTNRVHADLAAVLDLPMIEDVSASATRDASGITLFYAIRERPVIASLEFEGVQAFTRSELETAPIAEGQHLDTRALRSFARTLEKAYDERGYGSAKVDYDVKPGDAGKVRVIITAREGMPWKFGAIVFAGNKVLSPADLAKAAEIQTGEKWSADRLERSQLLVQALAYNRGLIECTVKVDRGAADGNGAVPVTMTIHEGDVFVLRKISIKGVTPAVEKQALAAMKAKPKNVFSREVLMNDMTAMRASLGMDVEPDVTLDQKTKSVDLVLEATKKTP